jgi:thiol-disulfide isomerase/thioredoxin
MLFLHINSEKDVKKLEILDNFIKNNSHVFILVYMEGCGPCNATRPEWKKLESALKDNYDKKDNLVVVDLNKDLLSEIINKKIGNIDGFPTMKYINNYGKNIETYENSSISKKDRSTDSFINWIESKINTVVSTSSPQNVYKRIVSKHNKSQKSQKKHSRHNNNKRSKNNKTKHHKKSAKTLSGGKWSQKYKNSIDCSKPKGFSQKQYCKYGRK